MRRWDIYLYPFVHERPHPVVILSVDELCENPAIEFLNGLLCASVRLDRPPKRRETVLDEADGLDWKTGVRCDFIYTLNKAQLQQRRGRVSEIRQIELLRKIRFCFRCPPVVSSGE
ncbi:MAG: type II toxin-antitoxin system PemK/MazF family toxin [Verrucomicrobiales bacterium]|nr:type II toxin-antitoxin system PemK/MazF family toxin [Verrucomicrobiales bacterium]